jgi:flagellar M-ring protein FliF
VFDRFRKAPIATQVTFVLLAVVAFTILLAGIWYLFLRVDYEPMFTRLRPGDAATIVGELENRKIPYRLTDGGTTILVPQEKADATRISIVGSHATLKDAVGFELFNKSDMGITDFAQKINFQRALQGELERTILTLDGVDSARVHLSMGEDRVFREDRAPPKASVTLHMVNGAMVPAGTVQGVQQLVAAAVPQLEATNVVVLDEGGQVLSTGIAATRASADLPPDLEGKRAIEQYYEARVREALGRNAEGARIDVTVWADIEPVTGEGGSTLPDFDIANRAFRLQVSLVSKAPLTAQARSDLTALAEGAVGYKPALGDAIRFGAAPAQSPPVPGAPGTPVVRVAGGGDRLGQPAAQADGPVRIDPWIVVAVVAVVLLLALAGLRLRAAAASPIGERAHIRFADRLKHLLEEGEADAGTRA